MSGGQRCPACGSGSGPGPGPAGRGCTGPAIPPGTANPSDALCTAPYRGLCSRCTTDLEAWSPSYRRSSAATRRSSPAGRLEGDDLAQRAVGGATGALPGRHRRLLAGESASGATVRGMSRELVAMGATSGRSWETDALARWTPSRDDHAEAAGHHGEPRNAAGTHPAKPRVAGPPVRYTRPVLEAARGQDRDGGFDHCSRKARRPPRETGPHLRSPGPPLVRRADAGDVYL
jgi:hypothetical protein